MQHARINTQKHIDMARWETLPEHLKGRANEQPRKTASEKDAEMVVEAGKITLKDLQESAKRKAKPVCMVGIDPGTNTGIAIREGKEWKSIQTLSIIEAIEIVVRLHIAYAGSVVVRIEDARLRTYFGKTGPEKWKGAGSIIRDCRIWEAEMERQGIRVEWVHPKDVKATTAEQFKKLTGWEGRTSIHAREAAWMII